MYKDVPKFCTCFEETVSALVSDISAFSKEPGPAPDCQARGSPHVDSER